MNRGSIIPLSAMVVGGTLIFAELNTNHDLPSNKQWLGLSVVYLGISLGHDLGFKPAGGFAALLAVAVFVSRGGEAFSFLNTKTGTQKTHKRTKPKRNVTVTRTTERLA